MTSEELLKAAKKARKPAPKRICTDKWMPAVDELRHKNWTFEQIYHFFRDSGETVHKTPALFIATVSRSYRTWLRRLGRSAVLLALLSFLPGCHGSSPQDVIAGLIVIAALSGLGIGIFIGHAWGRVEVAEAYEEGHINGFSEGCDAAQGKSLINANK